MKHRPLSTPLIGILVVGFCFALPGWAQSPTKMSPAKMTCEDFVAVDSAYQPTLVYWAAGVDKLGIRETDTLVVDTATPIAVIVGECKKTPKASFKSKVHDLSMSGQINLFDHH